MSSMISQWMRSYEQSHASVARILAQEAGINVVVGGSDFANSSDFQILGIVRQIVTQSPPVLNMQALKKASSDQMKIHKTQKNRAGKSLLDSTIYMPALPPDSPPQLHKALDGGLLHEIFHSLYTTRGVPNLREIHDSLEQVWDDTKIRKVAGLLPIFWNVFEDVMIERRGCDAFLGSPPLLQAVHEYLWERERDIVLEPLSRTWYISKSVGYLRDYCKSLIYLNNTPLYEDEIRDIYTQEIFDLALKANTTCETLVVAVKALYQLWDFLSEQEPEQDDASEDSEDTSEDESMPGVEGSGGQGEEKESKTKGSKDDKGSPGIPTDGDTEPDGEGDETSEEGEGNNPSDQGDTENEDEGKGEGEDDSSEEEGSGGDGDEEQSDQESKGGEDTAPLTMKDLEGLDENLSKIVEEALKAAWDHKFQQGRQTDRIVRPSHIKDVFTEANSCGSDVKVDKLNTMIQPQLARLKPPIVALLQNRDKMVRKSYQETGRSLSSRSLSTVLAQKPRPFEQRYQEHAEKSCVLILIDLSGSMQVAMDVAAAALLAVSNVLHSLNTPFGIIGFTSQSEASDNMEIYTHTDRLLLYVAKDFNEKFSKDTQKKIAGLGAIAATPLPDMFDLGSMLLRNRSEKNKHLWVISDGAPYYASNCQVDTLTLLKKRMDAASLTTKPFLLNVDIQGSSTHTAHLNNTQTIRSFEQVPTALMNHLKNK